MNCFRNVSRILYGNQAKYFEDEIRKELKHERIGTVSMANKGPNQNGSQFFITTSSQLNQMDGKNTVFGQVTEGFEILDKINNSLTDEHGFPKQIVRIKHTIVLEDPFPDPSELVIPDKSPEWDPKKAAGDRVMLMEEDLEGLSKRDEKTLEQVEKETKEKEAKSRAEVLEMIGDLPTADAKPPDNVLFVCKLNAATTEEDLELIFSRFGEIRSCEIIRDWKTGDSLQYSFIEFANARDCETAYSKMENVLIDDRRIHVDFSQSVSKQVMGPDGRSRRVLRHDWVNKRPTNSGLEEKKGRQKEKESGKKFELKSQRSSHSDGYQLVTEPSSTRKKDDQKRDTKRKERDEDGHSNRRRKQGSGE